MKNAIKFLSLCFLAMGMTIFVSCGSDDETTLPDDEIVCDSLTAQINMFNDSLNIVLSVETFGYNGPLNYIWSTGETTSSISLPFDDEGTYSVTVTADGAPDCEATGSIDLMNPVDCSTLSSNITLTGDSNPTAMLDASASGGTAPYTYLWTTGESTASITVSEDGTYGVSVSDANGCVSASV
ncbi:MAG: SprB repeat-containing protein, partial [Saprospiraceae bacterium]